MENTYLKYGDLILLYIDSFKGYLQTQGYHPLFSLCCYRFTNPNCYIHINGFNSEIFSRNQRDYVFQLYPKLNYDARKDYD